MKPVTVRLRACQADLARLAEVRRLAQELTAGVPRLDVLVNNAGMMSARKTQSADGYDLTFAVNHLAPYLLTRLLRERLEDAGTGRIVVVASDAHRRATLDFEDLMNERVSGLLPAYSRSKLANILFTRALARRLAGTGVTANCLHPGLVNSHLFHDSSAFMRVVFGTVGRAFMLSPRQGARTSIYLATSAEVNGASGGYYDRCRRVSPSPAAENDADAQRLWEVSAHLTGLAA